MFIKTNIFSALAINEGISKFIYIPQQFTTKSSETKSQIKINPSPRIFVREVLDFIGFRHLLITLIGSINFLFKSSKN